MTLSSLKQSPDGQGLDFSSFGTICAELEAIAEQLKRSTCDAEDAAFAEVQRVVELVEAADVADLLAHRDAVAQLLSAALSVACRGKYGITAQLSADARGQGIVASIARLLKAAELVDSQNPLVREIGSGLDRWSQATGIEVENPTGVWSVRVDAVAQGWYRPRVKRPAAPRGICPALPTLQELYLFLLGGLPEEERGERLLVLVEQGMNLRLAEELAEYGGIDLDA